MLNLSVYTELLKYFPKWPLAGAKYRTGSGAALIEVNDQVIQWLRGEERYLENLEKITQDFNVEMQLGEYTLNKRGFGQNASVRYNLLCFQKLNALVCTKVINNIYFYIVLCIVLLQQL